MGPPKQGDGNMMPIQMLEKSMNKKLTLLLKDGRTVEGTLTGFDEHMNLVLDDTDERRDDSMRKIGQIILRGNNVVTISRD